MEFITLVNRVRSGIDHGNIPLSHVVPETTMFTLPMRFKRGTKSFPRRTIGYWVSFEVEEPGRWREGYSAVYFFSLDGEFAIAFRRTDDTYTPLEQLSVVSVLGNEDTWRRGLTWLLDQQPLFAPTD